MRGVTPFMMGLMGNIPLLDLGVRGSAEDVKAAALDLLRKVERKGTILSLGGGVSPGMPGANIAAMAEAAREFNSQSKSQSTESWTL